MPESLGARLRQRREEKGIALFTIAQQTKIKQALLEGLERDDVSEWPSKIYRRAFVRAYARAIDLDPDTVIREFLEAHPDPPEVDVIEAMASALDRVPANSRATTLRTVVDSAIGSLARLRRGSGGDSSTSPVPVVGSGPGPTTTGPGNGASPPFQETTTAADPVKDVVASEAALAPPLPAHPDLTSVAYLCTELGRAGNAADVQMLLQEAARILDATGLIIWLWDAGTGELKPALVHGYSQQVLSQLPPVRRDADNATATAFRSAHMCAVGGSDDVSGALAVPLLTSLGCTGVLAIELTGGGEKKTLVRAIATILASLLAQIVSSVETVEVEPVTAVSETARWGTSRF